MAVRVSRGARHEAAAAARKLLQESAKQKLRLVTELAQAGEAVDAAEETARAAQEAVGARQADYSERYRAALAGGWTSDELTRVGYPADRVTETHPPRRRGRQQRTTDEPVAAVAPASQQEQTALTATG